MVQTFSGFPSSTTSLTLRDRAFDTINESLVIAGGSCLDMQTFNHHIFAHLLSHIVYKYIMATLENPLAILDETP